MNLLIFLVVLSVGLWFMAKLGMLDSIMEMFKQDESQGEYDLGFTHELYVMSPTGTAKLARMKTGAIKLEGEKEWRPGYELYKNLIPEHESVLIERKGILYTNLGFDNMVYDDPPASSEHMKQIFKKNKEDAERNAILEREIIGHKADKDYVTADQKLRKLVENLASTRDAVQPMGLTREQYKKLQEQMGGRVK